MKVNRSQSAYQTFRIRGWCWNDFELPESCGSWIFVSTQIHIVYIADVFQCKHGFDSKVDVASAAKSRLQFQSSTCQVQKIVVTTSGYKLQPFHIIRMQLVRV